MSAPLAGIRILDLTRVFSGPWATVMLADLGADVIKVEAIGSGGDLMRHMGGYNRGGVNGIFMGLNRGKRSIALDLTQPAAQDLVRAMAARADVVIANFRPGVVDRLGLAAADLHRIKPDLIIVSIYGFGADGPSAAEPAYDTVIQGRSGIASRQKRDADAEPDVVRSFISDKLGGFFAVQSILAALVARSSGVAGQTIDVSLLNASMYYIWPDVMQEIAFVGEASPGVTFAFQRMMWKTLDGHLVYAAVSLEDRRRLAAAVGRDDLINDPRFVTLTEAVKPENFAVFGQEIALALASMTSEDAVARLKSADVPVALVAEPADILADPHIAATQFVQTVDHPTAGQVRHPTYPGCFSATRTEKVRPAPMLGEHTREILDELGFDEKGIDDLIDAKAVGEWRRVTV